MNKSNGSNPRNPITLTNISALDTTVKSIIMAIKKKEMLGVYLIDLQYRRTPKQTYISLEVLDNDRFYGTHIVPIQIWGTLDFKEIKSVFTITKELLDEMLNDGSAVKLL